MDFPPYIKKIAHREYYTSMSDWCQDNPSIWYCSRPKGHEGVHIAWVYQPNKKLYLRDYWPKEHPFLLACKDILDE